MARVIQAGARVYPRPAGFVRAVGVSFSKQGLELVVKKVEENLSGRVLKKKSGVTFASVRRNSKIIVDGFEVGVGGGGAIWEAEDGFKRKAYTIIPRKKLALAFDKEGKRVITKKVTIPAQTFAGRPFLVPAVRASLPSLNLALNVQLKRMYGLTFPDVTMFVDFNIKS